MIGGRRGAGTGMAGLWPIVLRSIRARPLRALLTAIAVGLGVAAVLGVQLTLGALDDQARDVQGERAGRSSLDIRTVEAAGFNPAEVDLVRAVPGVEEARPFLEKPVTARYDPGAIAAPSVSLLALSGGEVALRPVRVVAGRLPAAGSLSEVALDEGLASALQATGAPRPIQPGDNIRLTTVTGPDRFRVVGIAAGTSGGLAFTRSAVYVSEAAATGAFALGLRTPLIAVRLRPGADRAGVAATVRDRLNSPVVAVDPSAGAAAPLDEVRPLLALLAALSVVIGAGVTANSVAVGALERRREIGLLRAAGASMRQVFRMLVGEAALLAVTGAVLGVIAGIVLGAVLIHRFSAAGLPVPSPPLTVVRLVTAVVAGGGAAVLASALPAIAARRVPPLVALRAAPGADRERPPRAVLAAAPVLAAVFAVTALVGGIAATVAGALALLLAVALLLPYLAPPLARGMGLLLAPVVAQAPVAAANLARRRNRTALTAAGLSTGVAAATAIGILTSGALRSGDRWVDRLFVGDVVVSSPATQPDGVADELTRTAQVPAGSRVRYLAATVGTTPLSLAAIDPSAYARAGALEMVAGDRTEAFAALGSEPAVLVPERLATTLGWRVGTRLPLLVGGRAPATIAVAGIVSHSLPSGDQRESLLLDRGQATRLFGPAAGGFDVLQVASGGGAAQARVVTASARYGMRATTVNDIRDAVGSALGRAVSLVTGLAWLAVTIAMLAVVNTLMVNVRLGTQELALLRAVGLSRRQALGLVLTEAGLLVATGVVAGVAAGCLIAVPLLRESGGPGFDVPFVFPVLATVASAAVLVGAALLAALIPGRRSAGASIVAAVHQE